MHRGWLGNLVFAEHLLSGAREKGKSLLALIASNMRPSLFTPRERPTPGRLYVVVKGIAVDLARRKLIAASQSWGAYEAISHARPPRIETVRASTFLQVLLITPEVLARLPDTHPELQLMYLRLRVWALLTRLRNGVKRALMVERAPELLHGRLSRASTIEEPDETTTTVAV